MKQETLAILSGKNPKENKGSVNTPIYKTSTVLFPTLKDYHDADIGHDLYNNNSDSKTADFSYGLTGTPTTFALQKLLSELDGGAHSMVAPSGLLAITTVLLSFLSTGDHILIADTVYGPTRRFCNYELKRLGIETTFYSPTIGKDIAALIKKNTKIVFTESPGSLTFEVQDIPAIAKVAHAKGAVVIMDNSWATSLYFKPFEHGVDVSIQAGTKYIGGHSDLLLGTITTTDEHVSTIFKTYKNLGVHTDPEICYMAMRGIRTMPTRLKAHEKAAVNIAKWLEKRPEVAKVLHPAFPSCPGHEIWKRDFTGSTGLFSIILDKKYSFEALSAMINKMKIFGIGSSWGGFESLAIIFDPRSVRTAEKWAEKGSCVRLYIGLEAEEDLIKDLEAGFKRLSKF
jgi:cystathionine beta-lyase